MNANFQVGKGRWFLNEFLLNGLTRGEAWDVVQRGDDESGELEALLDGDDWPHPLDLCEAGGSRTEFAVGSLVLDDQTNDRWRFAVETGPDWTVAYVTTTSAAEMRPVLRVITREPGGTYACKVIDPATREVRGEFTGLRSPAIGLPPALRDDEVIDDQGERGEAGETYVYGRRVPDGFDPLAEALCGPCPAEMIVIEF